MNGAGAGRSHTEERELCTLLCGWDKKWQGIGLLGGRKARKEVERVEASVIAFHRKPR